MEMKKIIYLALSLALVGSLTGCNEDAFLREDPKNLYTKENAFEKSSQVDAVIVNAYIKFDNMNGFSNPFLGPDGASNILHGDGSDVLGGTRGESDAAGSFGNYWALQSTNDNFSTLWTSLYQLGSYANLALYGIESLGIPADDPEIVYLTAQARFLRGWTYLRLAECFGGVPIVDKFSEQLKFDYTRASREDTYAFAIEDLKFAAENLPEYPKVSGRAAKGVAYHFLSEAYLAMAVESGKDSYLTEAVKAADEVIARHPLMTSRFGSRSEHGTQPAGIPDNGVPRYRPDGNAFFDLFCIGNYAYSSGNTESLMIFEQPSYENVSVNGGGVLPFGCTIGPAYRDLTWNSEYLAQNRAAGAGGGPWQTNIDPVLFPGQQLGIYLSMGTWGIIGASDYSDEYVWRDAFAKDDRNAQINRYDPVVMDSKSPQYLQVVTKDMLQVPASLSRVSGKITTWDLWGWNLAHCSSMGIPYCNQYGRDWYIARSAETYLLRAEAKLRLGDKSGAADDINTVRSRANAGYMYNASEVDIYVILDERARELAWEEMRWPTLLRMGGRDQNEVMHTQLENHSMHTSDTKVFAGKEFPKWTLFAIPYSVIQLNSDAELTQNYGWN